jgi:hypothetical protein
MDRRAVLAGVGGLVAGTLVASRAAAAPPAPQGLQAVLDKIARTDQGFGECCLPVQAFPGSSAAFTLTRPGSYYLNGNVMPSSGQNGIEIASDHVDLDLNGYSVLGSGGGAAGTATGTGILVTGRNVSIYDGSVAGFDVGVDMTGASHSMTWDVTCMDCVRGGFACGSLNQHYDDESHRCGTGFFAPDSSSLLQECGAYACGSGFRVTGSRNVVISNQACDCPVAFDVRDGNAWGPIVVVSGDLSLLPHASDVNANFVT